MSVSIDDILEAAVVHEASDIYIQENEIPRLKIHDSVVPLGDEALSLQQVAGLWQACGANVLSDNEKDTSITSVAHVRFRINLHKTMGRLGAVLRRIQTEIPDMEALGLPSELLKRWVGRSFGFILVTGPTGMGKTTTIASMLEWLNQYLPRHVVSIEDPAEFIFQNKVGHFTQREVGKDTPSFAQGLRASLRQAPDVIFVGEIRDPETALTALQAAETGHLVFSTLHSESVPETLERFLNIFPSHQANIATYLLSRQLIGIMCQKLVPKIEGGLHLIYEHMENGGALRDWIHRREVDQITDYLKRAIDPNAVSFMKSTLDAYQKNLITESTAIEALGNEMEFRRAIRGISS